MEGCLLGDKLPLEWWKTDGPERDAGMAMCEQAWARDKTMFDDFAAATRYQLGMGVDPAVVRTMWTEALLKRNGDAGPSAYAWFAAGLILRLAQSLQMDLELSE